MKTAEDQLHLAIKRIGELDRALASIKKKSKAQARALANLQRAHLTLLAEVKSADRGTRTTVRNVECPECGASPGTKCVKDNGQPRSACHAERWAAYRETA